MSDRPLPLWILAAQADRHPAEARAAFAQSARAGAEDAAFLVTCHRVEVVATGERPRASIQAAAGEAAARGLAHGLRAYAGREAAEHLFRLAAGLESAVTGEDEILHQVRELLDDVREAEHPDAVLVRALEVAIGVGRRSRAERERPQERGLADRALDWVASRGVDMAGSSVLVVGAGVMGRAVAVGAGRRGGRVTVASRDVEHARSVARLFDGEASALDAAAERFWTSDAVVVALAGPWVALERVERAVPGPAAAPCCPAVVDLSSPPALSGSIRAHLGERYVGIDDLFAGRPQRGADAERVRREYVEHAERLVAEAADRFARWVEARPSIETLRALRASAEARRVRDLERLLRRLPDLDPRQRALVSAFSEQLVAGILHAPSARLHDDSDGSAAAAARRLFGL